MDNRNYQTNQVAKLSAEISLLAEMHNRRLSDAAQEMWVESLMKFQGPALTTVLRKECTSARMPSLGDVLNEMQRIARDEANRRRRQREEREDAERLERLRNMTTEEQGQLDASFARLMRALDGDPVAKRELEEIARTFSDVPEGSNR